MGKLRVGVLMGGKSIEKEVAFNSGRTVCDHLDTARYTIVPLFQHQTGSLYVLPWRFLHRGKITDFEHRLEQEAQLIGWNDLKQYIDFMYIALHGRYAEDGILQGFLQVLGIPYLGSKVLSSALSMDKIVQKQFLRSYTIAVANDVTIYPHELTYYTQNTQALYNRLEQAHITYPCIVKPHNEGSSLGISVVHTKDTLITALHTAAKINPKKPQAVLIEEYLTGLEFSCIILTDYNTQDYIPLPPTQIVTEPNTWLFDYRQKYMPGQATKFTPARCDTATLCAIQKTCVEVMKILGIHNLARIDGFVTPDQRIVITDPNTFSGMAPSSFISVQAAQINMSHTRLINHLIETELVYYNMHTLLDTPLTSSPEHTPEHAHEYTQTPEKKLRVAVLLGGRSHEREISLESGRNIFYKLSPHNYTPLVIFVSSTLELYLIDQKLLVKNATYEIEQDLDPASKITWDDLKTIADFVFIGLHGGEGENGCVQGALEMLDIPYNGSGVLTSALCIDKYKTTEYLKSHGFEVPAHILVAEKNWKHKKAPIVEHITHTLDFPLIVKPHDDGCSVLVAKACNQEQLIQAIDSIFQDTKHYALIEEYITGTELTVGVIGNNQAQALPPSKTVTAGDILSIEEKFLPGAGENQTPAPLPAATLTTIQETIARAYKILHCKGYARIDCFYQTAEQSPTGHERVVILEVNTLPGMTPATCIFHQAAELGIKPMDFIDMIIQLGLEEHTKQELLVTEQSLHASQPYSCETTST